MLIDAVAASGGHLGSNLGSVELTLALHRVFESPRDALVWDTGHQAYVHKLVTGRRDGFARLRQAGGMSGYPSRAESEHDVVENSHASTALSYAYGLAVARDTSATDPDAHVVAVIGDGALTGGLAYEALNNLGSQRPARRRRAERQRPLATRPPCRASPRRASTPATCRRSSASLGCRVRRPDRRPRPRRARARAARRGRGATVRWSCTCSRGRARGTRRPRPTRRSASTTSARSIARPACQHGKGSASSYTGRVRRNAHRARRGAPGDRRAHRGHARFHRAVELRRALPRPLLRRRHRRAARGHRRRGHGDARAAPLRRDLLRVPEPRVGPTRLRRRPARAPGGLLRRPRRHHRRRRCQPPRPLRPRAAHQGPRDDRLRAVVLRRGRRDARPRRCNIDGPVALRWPKTPARQVGADQVGHGRSARKVRPGGDVCVLAVGKMVEAAEEAAALLDARGVCTPRSGTCARCRSTGACSPRRAATDLVITAEDGIAEGGVGAAIVSGARPDGERPAAAGHDHARHPARVPAAGQARRPARQPRSRRPRHRRHRAEGARRRQLTLARQRTGVNSLRIATVADASMVECGASSPRCDIGAALRGRILETPTRTVEAPVFIDGFVHQLPDVDPPGDGGMARLARLRHRRSAAAPEPATCSPGSWSRPGSRASACRRWSAPTTSTPSRREQEPWFPGDEVLERRIRAYIRWNAMAMVDRSNYRFDALGGHLSTFASAAGLYDVGFNHFFRGKRDGGFGDQIFFQGHAAPGIYARAFLEGRLTEEQLDRFRREVDGGGLPSYPHPRRMPEFWEFPTVSMGLGPLNAVVPGALQPLPAPPRDGRHACGAGCGRSSATARWTSPSRWPALSIAAREQLDNLIFVVNCNLQRLDGPVRGNGKIIQELEAIFRGAGLERDQGDLGRGLGRAARPRRRRRARQQDEQHRRRRVPEVRGGERRLHPRALLRPRPAPPAAGRAPLRRRPAHAPARRPRLPQGLRRLQDGGRARGQPHRDPRQDDQGLDARHHHRVAQRDAPDQEAHRRRAQGVPRPAAAADPRRRARRRRPAVLAPGHSTRPSTST